MIQLQTVVKNWILSQRFGSDQWEASPLQRVANQWVAWGGRFHSNQFKNTFYHPAIMECNLCLSAPRTGMKINQDWRILKLRPLRIFLTKLNIVWKMISSKKVFFWKNFHIIRIFVLNESSRTWRVQSPYSERDSIMSYAVKSSLKKGLQVSL